MKHKNLQDFLGGYLVCALWSSTDNATESGGEPLDDNYDVDDIPPEEKAKAESDCKDFVEANLPALTELTNKPGYGWSSAGHDFWLTRNGHGAGFWDRGFGKVGDELSAAAKVYSSVDIYVGDDGKLYFQ